MADDNRDALDLHVPPAGSAKPYERGELASFTMQSDGTREASGINVGMTRVPEAPEGRIAGPGNHDVWAQGEAKHTSERPGPYNKGWRGRD
jgi:hypothetical protein